MKKHIHSFIKIICLLLVASTQLHAQWQSHLAEEQEPVVLDFHSAQQQDSSIMMMAAAPADNIAADKITPEILALAQTFGRDSGNPQVAFRVYEWVRNNVAYECYKGAARGAHFTMLDKTGNDFDQAALLVALLRAAGYADVQYRIGSISLPLSAAADWLGCDQRQVKNYLKYLHMDFPEQQVDDSGSNLTVLHAWVVLKIGATEYEFAPAIKPLVKPAGAELPSTHDILAFLNSAATCITTGSTAVDNIYAQLGSYTMDLEAAAGKEMTGAELAGIPYVEPIRIVGDTPPALPFTKGTYATSAGISRNYAVFLQMGTTVKGVSWTSSYPFEAVWTIPTAEITGKLTLEYSANGSPPALKCSGTAYPYSAVWPIQVPGTDTGSLDTQYFSPSDTALGAYNPVYADGRIVSNIPRDPSLPIVISQGFGQTRGRLQHFLEHNQSFTSPTDAQYVVSMLFQTLCEEFFKVLGGVTDNICSAKYHAGLVHGGSRPHVDMFGSIYASIPRTAQGATTDEILDNNARERAKLIMLMANWASAMEHVALEQALPVKAVSTVRILEEASMQGREIWLVKNLSDLSLATANQPNLTISDSTKFRDSVQNNRGRLLFPKDIKVKVNDYEGCSYVLAEQVSATGNTPWRPNQILMAFDQWNGASVSKPISITSNDITRSAQSQPTPPASPDMGDPVNTLNGAFYKDVTDLVIGDGQAPLGLSFARHYSSARRNQNSAGLGRGWTHSYNITLNFRHPMELDAGTMSVAEAAPLVIAAKAMYDTYDPEGAVRTWLAPALIACWAGDQLINTRASVAIGNETLEFVKRPDGSFAPPPGVDATLEKNESDGKHTLQFYEGLQIKFRTDGRFESITDTTLGKTGPSVVASYNGSGQLTKVADAFGRFIQLNYSGAQLASVKDSSNRTVSFGNNTTSRIYTTIAATGGTSRMYYNSNYCVTKVEDELARVVLTSSYNALNQVSSQRMLDDSNRIWTLGAAGGMSRQTDPQGNTKWWYFDKRGLTRASVDELGSTSHALYDAANRVVSTTTPRGKTTSFAYGEHNQVISIIDPVGNSTLIDPEVVTGTTFDTRSISERTVMDRENNETITTYHPSHRVNTITLPGGEKTEFIYDDLGRIKKTRPASYPDNAWIEYSYSVVTTTGYTITGTYPDATTECSWLNGCGDIIQTVDRSGRRTTTTYDASRRPLTVARWSGSHSAASNPNPLDTPPPGTSIIISNSYNAAGELIAITDPNGFTSSSTYNALGDLVSSVDASGVTQISNIYNVNDKLWESTGAIAGQTVIRTYDAAGHLSTVTDPLRRMSMYGYNEDGLVTEFSTSGTSITLTTYDDLGNPAIIEDPMEKEIHYTYDKDGRQTKLANRRGRIFSTTYNLAGREVRTATPLGFETTVKSNLRGLVEETTFPSGRTVKNTAFDFEGRASTQTIMDSQGNIEATRHYTYMPGGPLLTLAETIAATGSTTTTTREYDDFYRLTAYHDGCGNTMRYEYDKAGNLTTLTYPDNSQVKYEYDACNRLVKVTDWADPVRVTLYEYDPAGRLAKTIRPNGTTRTHIHDYAGQLRYIEECGPNQDDKPLWLGACQYDLNGNISEIITSSTKAANWTQPADTAHYDDDNRLDTWNGDQVEHDDDGNMTKGPLPDGTPGNYYTYDMHNQLSTAGGVASNYNPDGLRTRVNDTTYVVDPNARLTRVLARTKGGVTTKYVWGANGLEYEETGGQIKTYHADHLGSTVAVTDGSGTVTDTWEYASYGTVTHRSGATDTPFRFHGALGCMTDSNGLVYMRARFYNPRIMRFLNQDPIGFAGGMNWFAAFNNNPLSNVDPLGLCANNTNAGSNSMVHRAMQTGRDGMGLADYRMLASELGFTGFQTELSESQQMYYGETVARLLKIQATQKDVSQMMQAVIEEVPYIITDKQGLVISEAADFARNDFISSFKQGVIVTAAGSVITGYTMHGLNQAISRNGVGVSPSAINDAVRNPVRVVQQGGGVVKYVGKTATVVVNSNGKVITTYATTGAGIRIVPGREGR